MDILINLLFSCNEDILLFQQFCQFSILVHRHQDIAATHKFLVDVELGYRWPVGVLFDSCIKYNSLVNDSVRLAHSAYIPCLSSGSSRTLNAVNFFGSTPCSPKICILARENPHWGVSGVPFMNSTTGADSTALSMAALVSLDKRRRN